MTRLLSGLRVALTRAPEDNASWASRLRELGVEPVLMPALQVVSLLDDARVRLLCEQLAASTWVVFASRRGVQQFAEALRRGAMDMPKGMRLGAVGPATAAAMLRLWPDFEVWQPTSMRARGVVREFPSSLPEHILLPAARGARPELGDGLVARGHVVHRVALYDTEGQVSPASMVLDMPGDVHAVVFASPSAVAGFVARWGVPQAPTRLVSIGPTTSAALRGVLGGAAREVTEADTPTFEGIVGALQRSP